MQRQAKKPNNWRLKKTLSRNVSVRPIEDEDIRFVYAAYRAGALGEALEGTELDAKTFKDEFTTIVLTTIDAAWIVETEKPIGVVFGNWHPVGEVMTVTGIAWFPWATPRNIIEGTVRFFNEARKDFPFIGYAKPEHRPLYETVCKHGIMRRVGRSENVFNDATATIFETKQ